MTISEIKKSLHRIRYTCGVNQRYHQRMAFRWKMADRVSKISVAAVATLALVATYWKEEFKPWEIGIAAIAAALAIVLNVVPFGEFEKFYDELFRCWADIRMDAEVLYFKLEGVGEAHPLIVDRTGDLMAKEHALHAKEPAPHEKLLVKCQQAENQSRWGKDFRTYAEVEGERAKRLQGSAIAIPVEDQEAAVADRQG